MKTKPKKYMFETRDSDRRKLPTQTYYLHSHCDAHYVYMFWVEGLFDGPVNGRTVVGTIEDDYRYEIQYDVYDGDAAPELLIWGIDSESQAHII